MRVFTMLLPPAEARARYQAALSLRPLDTESLALEDALGRTLAADITATEDLPPFDRSTVDGYAVRAADTPGATPSAPVRLRVRGEVTMGRETSLRLSAGEAARVPTGGVLPAGADAVVMQEQVQRGGDEVMVSGAVKPGENRISRAEDVRRGEVVLRAGRALRPQDLGMLAGLGHARVPVRVRPRVALLSTGDELVSPEATPAPGQLRDMNAAALGGLVRRGGAEPLVYPILPDDLHRVTAALRRAVVESDVVVISGGSSVGERDVVVDAIAALGPPGIIVHGVAMRPGKPVVLAVAGERPVIGLPGNPVSAMVTFDTFVGPVLAAMLGAAERSPSRVRARASRALAAPPEREDHVRVTLERRAGEVWAQPLPAKSGLLTTMVRADGIVVIPPGRRVEEGEAVEVEPFEA